MVVSLTRYRAFKNPFALQRVTLRPPTKNQSLLIAHQNNRFNARLDRQPNLHSHPGVSLHDKAAKSNTQFKVNTYF